MQVCVHTMYTLIHIHSTFCGTCKISLILNLTAAGHIRSHMHGLRIFFLLLRISIFIKYTNAHVRYVEVIIQNQNMLLFDFKNQVHIIPQTDDKGCRFYLVCVCVCLCGASMLNEK